MSVYLDDVLIASRNIKEHLEYVKKVLLKVSETGLLLKPSKCMFTADEMR